jgi:regulator of protease activity HflC (stomatin/prohibitin superfamily)
MEKTMRLVTKNFTTLETIEFRETLVHTIEQEVYRAISEEESLGGALYHLEMDVKNIGYPVKYTEAIEAKLAAEQAKIQAQFEYDRLLILASAEAQSKIIVANGTQQAIDAILQITGETNTTRIAELYLTVEAIKTVAPTTENFIVIFGQGPPLVYPIPADSTTP